MTAKRALVLAAGLGTRLRPFTYWHPKPLMPMGDSTLLEKIVRRLESWGVTDIAVNTHWLQESVSEWASRRNGTARIVLSHEPVILGTGGALIPLKPFFGDEPFWMVNADIAAEGVQPEAFDTEGIAAAWIMPGKGPCTLKIADGCIVDFRNRAGTATFCGWQLIQPEIWRYIPEDKRFFSIVEVYEAAIRKGERVRAVEVPGSFWDDAGTIDSYRRLEPAVELEYLGKRGSNREFWRLNLKGQHAICTAYDPVRFENTRYADHTRLLQSAGVPVPAILRNLPEEHVLVLEDLGTDSLEERMRRGCDARSDYSAVVVELARLHAVRTDGVDLEPPFDAKLFTWEHELFREHFLGEPFSSAVTQELVRLIRVLESAPRVLVHRDFQAGNILFKAGRPHFIDYQGMRSGPAVYDLASLLCDPYVEIPPEVRDDMIALYAELTKDRRVIELFWHGAVQRLLQALGAYGRLAGLGLEQFRKHIPVGLARLAEAADRAGYPAIGALCILKSKSF